MPDPHQFDADPDPDPTFHFDAVPDSDPSFRIEAQKPLNNSILGSFFIHFGLPSVN